LVEWNSRTNRYAVSRAPASFRGFKGIPQDLPELDLLFRDIDPFTGFQVNLENTPLTVGQPVKIGDATFDSVEAKLNAKGSPFSSLFRILIGQKDHLIHGMVYEGSGKRPDNGQEMKFKAEHVYEMVEPGPGLGPSDFRFVAPPGARPASGGGR